jgi:hypothetical protein
MACIPEEDRSNTGKPHRAADCSGPPDAREGQAGRDEMTERLVRL